MSDDTEAMVIQALQGDADAIRWLSQQINALRGAQQPGQPTPEQLAVKAGQERADFLHAADEFKRKYSDLYDDGLGHIPEAIDKDLAAKHPNAPYRARLDEVGRLSYKVLGTPEQRAIRAMKLQRNPHLKPEDLVPDVDAEEALTEFDLEHAAGKAEAIEDLRQSRAGRMLTPEQREKALEWDALQKRRRASGA